MGPIADAPHNPLLFMQWTASRLRRHAKEHGDAALDYRMRDVVAQLDWPMHWRDEAPDSGSREEFLIRYARSIGVHMWYDLVADKLKCRLTKDELDEATITWPNKPSE